MAKEYRIDELVDSEELYHHGIKGQKWGVRRYQNKDGTLTPAGAQRYKDEVNSKERYIKEGTELQTIAKRAINLDDSNSRRSKRLYTAYTEWDKTEYTNMMGNFMYDGDPAYKNTFVVKKDMKVASDRDVVEAFLSIAKKNPEAVTKDIANAYNENALFFKKAESKWQKKVSQLTNDPNDAKNIKMAEEYVRNAIVGQKSTTTDSFYSYLTSKGFDAISDTNDRKTGASQDPLIVINMGVIKQTGSVKLSANDLQKYYDIAMSDEHIKKSRDLKGIQR